MPHRVYRIDTDGRLLYVNQSVLNDLGLSREDVLGRTAADSYPETHARKYRADDERVLSSGEPLSEVEVNFVPHMGKHVAVEVRKTPVFDAQGRVVGLQGVFIEVAGDADEQLDLLRKASTDALTGLNNRWALDNRLQSELHRSTRYGNQLSLLLMDVDHFKAVNDTLGHLHGDDILRKLARELSRSSRASDFLARFGGEEFVILLPETDLHDGVERAERIRKKVEGRGKRLSDVTLSIGVACSPMHGADADTLLKHADMAMYAAKRAGRNRCVPFGAELAPSSD